MNRQPHERHPEYQRKIFSMRQVRDCVAGSDAVKRAAELYLPMPSGMVGFVSQPTAVMKTGQQNPLTNQRPISITNAPWYHSNAAYSAYLHRAKFPDITANTLRGLVGVAKRKDPVVELPPTIKYLEEVPTQSGDSIYALFAKVVSEIFQVGRFCLVLDVRKDNSMFIAQYPSESYVNWDYEVIDGHKVQTYAEFEMDTVDSNGSIIQKSLCYSLEAPNEADIDIHKLPGDKRICVAYHYTDGKLDEDGRKVILFQGKTIDKLPLQNFGAEENTACIDCLPMIGISDCALDIYRHSADLHQSHFMNCNPTLVFIGVDADDAPKMMGSTVAICLSSKDADAKYVIPENGALDHVSNYMGETFQEAVGYGANLLGPNKRAAESAEALALRQSAAGATLITIVGNAGSGLEAILQMASDLMAGGGEVEFTPNTKFAEMTMSAQDVTALVSSWMSGGISHLTLLENLAEAGKLGDRTPEEELEQIENEGPALGDDPNEQDPNANNPGNKPKPKPQPKE